MATRCAFKTWSRYQAWTIQRALYSHGSSMGLRVYQRQTFLGHRQRQAFTVKNVSIGWQRARPRTIQDDIFGLAHPASLPQCLDEELCILCVSKRIGLVHIVSVEVWLMAQERFQLRPRLIPSA
jgi:hypothetical protein